MKSHPLSLLALGVAASLLAGCYEVPVTGRHALNIVDDKDVTKMSVAAFDQMKATNRISHDVALNEELQRVGERLQKTIPMEDIPDADWEFVLFDNPQVNAFAMAGGKVGVFTGLFKIVQNEDQLASVVAHEIGHVAARHIHEQLSQEMAMQTGGVLGSVALMGSSAGFLTQEAIMQAYGIGATASGFAFDRKKEKEADHIGLVYMARAGYDPHEAVKVLEKLEEEMGSGQSESAFGSTHPSNPERISALEAEMPQALRAQEDAKIKPVPVVVK